MKEAPLQDLLKPLFAAALLVCLSCCSHEDPSPAPAQLIAKTQGSGQGHKTLAKTAPVEQQPRYSPVGRRDPFRSYLTDLAAQAAQHQPDRKPEPTEMFELGQYLLTGLVTGTSQPKAMVEDPDTQGHVLRIGSHLGKNGGVVIRIGQDGIVIAERTRDPTGRSVDLSIAIKLQRNETRP